MAVSAADSPLAESCEETWERISAMAGLDSEGGILPTAASCIDRSQPIHWTNHISHDKGLGD
jgi:hypothetical protein